MNRLVGSKQRRVTVREATPILGMATLWATVVAAVVPVVLAVAPAVVSHPVSAAPLTSPEASRIRLDQSGLLEQLG